MSGSTPGPAVSPAGEPTGRASRIYCTARSHPLWTLALALAVTLTAAAGLPRLELRMDGRALVPADDPTLLFDRQIRRLFGVRDPLVVVVETSHPDGIYNLATLQTIQRISEIAAEIPEIGPQHVTSLATERRDRVYPGTLKFRPFLDPLPDTELLMTHLKNDIEAAGILEGTLVSTDGRAAAVLIGVPDLAADGGFDRRELYRRVVTAVEALGSGTDRVSVVGAPAAEALLGTHVLADLMALLPASILVMSIMLGWRLRRLWGVLLGLTEIGACLVFTLGLMGWLGVPVYLTTAVLPVVLTTLGLADEIHVFSHYQLLLTRGGGTKAELVDRTLHDMVRPVTFTSVTTSIGFLSFAAAEIDPIRLFGIFAAVGILFCLLWTLTVVPAALVLLPADRLRRPRSSGPSGTVRWVRPFLRRRRWTLAALALVTLPLGLGVRYLYVQDSWIEGFAPRSSFRLQTEAVNRRFHGTHLLQIHLQIAEGEAEPPQGDGRSGPLLDPELLHEIGELEEFLSGLPGVGGVLGPHSHLSTISFLWLGRKPEAFGIPEDPVRVSRLLRFFEVVRGKHRRREVITDDLDQALVTVFLKNANYREVQTLIQALSRYRASHPGSRIGLRLAGDVAVSQAMIPAIVRSQVLSLLIALLGAALTLTVLFRSLATALLSLVPVSVAVLWTFGAMGWLGVPLGVATSMFCAITLGVGVDYAIHFLEARRRAQAAGSSSTLLHALEESGPAIVTDMLAIAGSFGLLMISNVPANARLGLLAAVALVAGCVLTLVGLGALLVRREEVAEPLSRRAPVSPSSCTG